MHSALARLQEVLAGLAAPRMGSPLAGPCSPLQGFAPVAIWVRLLWALSSACCCLVVVFSQFSCSHLPLPQDH